MAEQPLQTSVTLRASPFYMFFKHTLDRLVAFIVLVPVGFLYMLCLAWLIRRDSPGPAIFKQTRAGRGGKPFTLWKFRTMRTDVDPYGDSPQTGDDPHITRYGRWLRETSQDELPQLINVLLGHMSLIGPRPLYMQQMAEWDERQRGRLRVKPGLTGLAQINGRGSLTVEEKLEWDVRYVETLSFRNDWGIFWRTIANVWGKEGIYEVRYSNELERRSETTTEAQRRRE